MILLNKINKNTTTKIVYVYRIYLKWNNKIIRFFVRCILLFIWSRIYFELKDLTKANSIIHFSIAWLTLIFNVIDFFFAFSYNIYTCPAYTVVICMYLSPHPFTNEQRSSDTRVIGWKGMMTPNNRALGHCLVHTNENRFIFNNYFYSLENKTGIIIYI